MRKIVSSRGLLVGLAVLATIGIAACSANRAPSNAGPDTGRAPTPTATANASAAGTTVPFLSPSGNISCEVDYNYYGLTHAYCQTTTPPQSVTMDATGSYTTCMGEQCLGNPGIDTPTLAYGAVTGVGPFVCESDNTGVTCTVDGKGFEISSSGVTSV